MDSSIIIPRITTRETEQLRSAYPSLSHLEAGNVAEWLTERKDQLLIQAQTSEAKADTTRVLGLAATGIGTICYAINPFMLIGGMIGGAAWLWFVIDHYNRTKEIAPLPFVRGNFLDAIARMGDADLRGDEQNHLAETIKFLPRVDATEYVFLHSDYFETMVDYLAQVEAGKRFYAYRWLCAWFEKNKGRSIPGKSTLLCHLQTVKIDSRVKPAEVKAIQSVTVPRFMDSLPAVNIVEHPLLADSKNFSSEVQPAAPQLEPPTLGFTEQMYKNAWDILQGLVSSADASKLGGCVILAAPGAGKTTYLGTAWGRLKKTYADRFNSLAIVVKQSDVAAFRGVSDNCLCVKDDTEQVAVTILKFISQSCRPSESISRLFLDDFLTMNEYFDTNLSGVYVNTTTYEVYYSKKEDPSAKPLLKTLYMALNEMWLVGRQYNAALWLSSHSSNVDALPFVGSRESRSVGALIFLAHNNKREFIEQTLNNLNLIADNNKRQQLKAMLDEVKPYIKEPLVLANYNNWTFGIVPSELHDEYQDFRAEWETLELITPPREKLSDIINGLEKSLEISEQEPVKKEEEFKNTNLSYLALRLLSFFNNAKNKTPKGLADIKKKDDLREQGDIKLTIALTELVNTGHLVFDDKDSWSKSDW